ncbi:hypothetical protein ACF1HJ_28810 [Streptomyces sp. NPDC013978]|uniref:hypothetical protein n=1 Tax=Streptomyces sp. NPDC013978 TaxID=3364869 RepID=UPI0036FAC175
MPTGIAYVHAGEDVNPGSPSTRPAEARTGWTPTSGTALLQAPGAAPYHSSASSASTYPGLLNFAFHKGCALQPAVFSHTWVGDTRATTACNRTVGETVYANGNWAVGTPQALSYWPRLGTDQVEELWGLTEHICAGTTLRTSFPHEFKAVEEPDEKKNACDGYNNAANLSLRTVFAVGFDDSAVMNLH